MSEPRTLLQEIEVGCEVEDDNGQQNEWLLKREVSRAKLCTASALCNQRTDRGVQDREVARRRSFEVFVMSKSILCHNAQTMLQSLFMYSVMRGIPTRKLYSISCAEVEHHLIEVEISHYRILVGSRFFGRSCCHHGCVYPRHIDLSAV